MKFISISHSREEILDAYERGEPVWLLDTPNGNDDILFGEEDTIWADLRGYFDGETEGFILTPLKRKFFEEE